MLKLVSIVLFVGLLFVSCGEENKTTQKPTDLLDKSKMAAVLTDITLMEAAANVKAIQNTTTNSDDGLKFNVYKQHMISRKQYESSLNYYSANTKEFKEVYDIVLQNLNKQKGD